MYACSVCNDSYCPGCELAEEGETVTRVCRVCSKTFEGSEMDCFCSSACVMAYSKEYWDRYNGSLTAAHSYVKALTARSPLLQHVEGARNTHIAMGRIVA